MFVVKSDFEKMTWSKHPKKYNFAKFWGPQKSYFKSKKAKILFLGLYICLKNRIGKTFDSKRAWYVSKVRLLNMSLFLFSALKQYKNIHWWAKSCGHEAGSTEGKTQKDPWCTTQWSSQTRTECKFIIYIINRFLYSFFFQNPSSNL